MAETDFGITLPCRVMEVTDGDTVVVELKRNLRIRLVDCWAAELRTEEGLKAKRHLEKLIDGKDVRVTIELEPDDRFGDRMSFGRILARLEVDGRDVSELMCEAGFATKERSDD